MQTFYLIPIIVSEYLPGFELLVEVNPESQSRMKLSPNSLFLPGYTLKHYQKKYLHEFTAVQ